MSLRRRLAAAVTLIRAGTMKVALMSSSLMYLVATGRNVSHLHTIINRDQYQNIHHIIKITALHDFMTE